MIAHEHNGIALSGYFGGRAECRIRCVPVPVCYLDYTSMYPTVNALLDLWSFHTAHHVTVEDATEEVRTLLANVSLDRVLDPAHWTELRFFARVLPTDDILPVRAQYGHDRTYNIGLNRVTSDDPLWYTGPDLVASALLTGKAPQIDRAFRLLPIGRASDLRSVKLGGEVLVDPERNDFFRVSIEQRQRIKKRRDLNESTRTRLDKALKVIANSGSYGIFAEMNRRALPEGKTVELTVHSHGEPRSIACATPEDPGRYCCPPIAALITAGARLMLAALERCVTDAGGSYAFCDTDSMAIVATRNGGLVPCPGGPLALPDGRTGIRALSWAEVDAIVARFDALNPYDRQAVPHSILKVEKYNYVGNNDSNERREIYCYAISAKRYALFVLRPDGSPRIIHRSEHGLGALLNPLDPDSEDVADETEECEGLRWITRAWEVIVSRALGRSVEWPDWCNLPAVSRLTTSKPALLAPFRKRNRRKAYADQIKPHNFILTAYVAPNGHPEGIEPPFMLIAPYERDSRKWLKMKWTDRHSGGQFRISTDVGAALASRERARVLSYADMLARYATHPEPKSAAPDATECRRDTRGLLGRRHVVVGAVELIGKESNSLDEVSAGLVDDWDEVLNSYGLVDATEAVSIDELLASASEAEIAQLADLSRTTIKRLKKRRLRPTTRAKLSRVAASIARMRAAVPLPNDTRAANAVFQRLPEALRKPARSCAHCGIALRRTRARYCNGMCRTAAYRARLRRGC
jgi:hypothetical protein